MGLFKSKEERKMNKNVEYLTNAFKVLQGYTPMFSSYDGGIYEMELTRSAIETIALHCSKLNPVVVGTAKERKLGKILQTQPNYLMTTSQFLERLTTILLVENNAYIVPIYSSPVSEEIVGFFPVRSVGSKIIRDNGIEYLVYKIGDKQYAIEYDRVGHLRRHYYKKEYSGESNETLRNTMDLINAQNVGIQEGIKNGASIRFLARLLNVMLLEDILKERGNEKYIIKENEFEITLYDIINFISNQNNDPSLNDKLTNFFEKLNIMKEEKIKFLIEIVQDNVSFNNFIAEISNESNENEIYEKYKKLAVYYCAMHSIDA